MQTRVLKKLEDLETFALKCQLNLDLKYPIDYLEKSHVRAFYNNSGVMVGGYVLNHSGQFRVIESLPEHIRLNSHWTKKEVLEQTYEITGLWLDRRVSGAMDNFFFWATMYKEMIFTRKKYLVYAYDLDKTYLKKLYSIMNPSVIFSGKTILQEGMEQECEESVEIASVNAIRFGLLYQWDFFVKKLMIPRKKAHYYGISFAAQVKKLL